MREPSGASSVIRLDDHRVERPGLFRIRNVAVAALGGERLDHPAAHREQWRGCIRGSGWENDLAHDFSSPWFGADSSNSVISGLQLSRMGGYRTPTPRFV